MPDWKFATAFIAALAWAQTPQNPSPMTDSTREHRRVTEKQVTGARFELSTGTLLLPPGARKQPLPLVVHFHGAPWLAEWSVRKRSPKAAVLTVNLGSGSGVYSRAFAEPGKFAQLLDEARSAGGVRFKPAVITSFSAGYGAVREILSNRNNWPMIAGVLLMDSLHSGYADGGVERSPMQPFVEFAKKGRLLFTHSEVFPGTYASTTETADYLIRELGKKRKAVLRWGPGGMQQLSDVRAGKIEIMGFAGNSAPDHVDHFHGMAEWLRKFKL